MDDLKKNKRNITDLIEWRVSAGFPSPAESYIDTPLNLHDHVVKHPAATFFVRVSGDSMIGAGIFNGDLLVVDRSLEYHENSIIVAVLNGDFTVKRISQKNGRITLYPENSLFIPIVIQEYDEFMVWGVVTYSLREH